MAGRKGRGRRWRVWAAWLVIILGVGSLAGGFVGLRNAQVRAGTTLRKAEDRMAELESEIELSETRIARLLSRPELVARLRAMKPDLRRLSLGEAVRLRHPGAPQPMPEKED